ncbi:MAG: hypothetical protein EP343_06085 [Deltaproteobacteria bacterium]|nr:MAG: hypothetical protein EP343_06085 [Deltaproteobacteria bacterium]
MNTQREIKHPVWSVVPVLLSMLLMAGFVGCSKPTPTCTSVDDCLAEQQCYEGSCRPTCTSPDDCLGSDTCNQGKCTSNGTTDGGPLPEDNTCQPTTCEKEGKNCGEIPDGCGQLLNCGACPAGQNCGAKGPNVCGEGTCTATTCQAKNATCGQLPDGCGTVLNCGSCSPGQGCQNNQCVCQPKTCQSANAQCGEVSDGCGKTLQCGSCKAGQSCEDNNRCSCTPKSCGELGKTCGKVDNGCGETIDCGSCNVCKPSCLFGYNCKNGACEGGNAKDLRLNVETIQVSGKITLNRNNPQLLANCQRAGREGYRTFRVLFQETTYNYQINVYGTCESAKNDGFVFKATLFPGTYKVTVYGGESTNYSNLPQTGQVVLDKRDFKKDETNVLLDVKTIQVSGKITLNRNNPKLLANCERTGREGYRTFRVLFRETTYNYQINVYGTCESAKNNGFVYDATIFPGTYRVTVYGGESTNYSNLPQTGQVVLDNRDFTKNETNVLLDVKTIQVSGKITLNRNNPQLLANCQRTGREGYRTFRVLFRETTYNYQINVYGTCESAKNKGFVYDATIFPGTYRVTVYGGESTNYSNLPQTGQVVLDNRDFKKDETNVLLDVKTIQVSGKITLNRNNPKLLANCERTGREGYRTFRVLFRETTYNYQINVYGTCESAKLKGFVYDAAIFPGTYRITVYGGESTNYSNLPQTGQVVLDKRDFLKDETNVLLDVKTIQVSGKITLNRNNPQLLANCQRAGREGYRTFRVLFRESTYNYQINVYGTCESAKTKGFVYDATIFPGTYRVTVYGGESTNYSNLPQTGQVVLDKRDFTKDEANVLLDVKTIEVAGKITLNRNNPQLLANCQRTGREGYRTFRVLFRELEYNYQINVYGTCESAKNEGFTFKATLFPGLYRITVYGGESTNYSSLPQTGQIVADKIKLP